MLGAQENFTLTIVATKAPTMKTPSKVAASVNAVSRDCIVVTKEIPSL
ncbi:hypothetical protein SDC9_173368 [bioreactor metagenome]|uniref:Uncharacterized protein n=1 Tax=bioreactor metagenome TaxID=1076179 RepID=A0A645GGA0_9ZZZZ